MLLVYRLIFFSCDLVPSGATFNRIGDSLTLEAMDPVVDRVLTHLAVRRNTFTQSRLEISVAHYAAH